MKRMIPLLLSLLLLTGCGEDSADGYQQISQEEAKAMMDTQVVIILDVREQDEYDSGHIPGAVLLPVGTIDETTAADGSYQQITQEEAKEMMDTQEVIILDVREQDEYDSGHIPGAVLLPVGTIDETTAAEVIPEKDSTVLVYCRSGNRSKTASSALADLGYTNIYEFGGINTWPYETEP